MLLIGNLLSMLKTRSKTYTQPMLVLTMIRMSSLVVRLKIGKKWGPEQRNKPSKYMSFH